MVRKARQRGPARGRPSTGQAMSAAERMRRMRERRKAAGLKSVTTWVPEPGVRAPWSQHRLIEARSLAMHAVIAAKIERDRTLLDIARRNLQRWRARWENDVPAWHDEWSAIVQRPWPEIAAIITEPSEEGARLRQSSPFAGVLSVDERRRIYAAFRA